MYGQLYYVDTCLIYLPGAWYIYLFGFYIHYLQRDTLFLKFKGNQNGD